MAIRIFDLISTWYTRQLGAKYPDTPEAELLFYASGSYLTAECVVAAYGLLEQTTSTTVQLNKLLGYLKETILITDDAPETDGEYYVSREGRQDKLIKHLKKYGSPAQLAWLGLAGPSPIQSNPIPPPPALADCRSRGAI